MAVTFSPASPLDVMTGTVQVKVSTSYYLRSEVTKVVITSVVSTPVPETLEYVRQSATTYKLQGGQTKTFSRTYYLAPTAYGYDQGSGSITLGIRIQTYDASGNEVNDVRTSDTFEVTSIQRVVPILGITGIERSNYSGQTSDGGSYARFGINIVHGGDISQPVVEVDGTVTSSSWYDTYTEGIGCSGVISDWTSVASGDTIYGIASASTSSNHTIEITVTDSYALSSSVSGSVSKGDAYPLNFAAGGNGVGFGVKAVADKFKCALDSVFSGALKQVQVVGGVSTEVPVSLEGHGHNISDITWLDAIYPVGSLIWVGCTTTGTPLYNPQSKFGGSWSKVDEFLENLSDGDDEQVTTSSFWTRNTTNCTTAGIQFTRTMHNITITVYFVNKVAIGDTALEIITLDLAALGIYGGELPQAYPATAWTDGGEGIVMCRINETGVLTTYDYVSKSSTNTTSHKHVTVPAASTVQFTVSIDLTYSDVQTSLCKYFLYRRTA